MPAEPQIETFVAAVQELDVNTVAAGGRVAVTWQVANRGPMTNLLFEQVFDMRGTAFYGFLQDVVDGLQGHEIDVLVVTIIY